MDPGVAVLSHLHGWARDDNDAWACVECGVLFEDAQEARARTDDPDTSHEAAASVSQVRMTKTRQAILDLLKRYGPLSDERIWDGLVYQGLDGNTSLSGARTRRSELVAAGRVYDTGERAKGKTGRNMIVWAAKE